VSTRLDINYNIYSGAAKNNISEAITFEIFKLLAVVSVIFSRVYLWKNEAHSIK